MQVISKYLDEHGTAHGKNWLSDFIGRNDAVIAGKALDELVEQIVPVVRACPNGYVPGGRTGSKGNRPAVRTVASMCYERLVLREGLSMRASKAVALTAARIAYRLATNDADGWRSGWHCIEALMDETRQMSVAA